MNELVAPRLPIGCFGQYDSLDWFTVVADNPVGRTGKPTSTKRGAKPAVLADVVEKFAITSVENDGAYQTLSGFTTFSKANKQHQLLKDWISANGYELVESGVHCAVGQYGRRRDDDDYELWFSIKGRKQDVTDTTKPKRDKSDI